MRILIGIIVFAFTACNRNSDPTKEVSRNPDTLVSSDSRRPDSSSEVQKDSLQKPYANARFRNVLVKKTGQDKYNITGEGQIFEASFNWVIEDGHNELKSGYTTTDAGAPAWGKFDFSLTIPKHNPNATVHLIIYEASAKDGSRQHELPIVLK